MSFCTGSFSQDYLRCLIKPFRASLAVGDGLSPTDFVVRADECRFVDVVDAIGSPAGRPPGSGQFTPGATAVERLSLPIAGPTAQAIAARI